jgi:hypothetical protein
VVLLAIAARGVKRLAAMLAKPCTVWGTWGNGWALLDGVGPDEGCWWLCKKKKYEDLKVPLE